MVCGESQEKESGQKSFQKTAEITLNGKREIDYTIGFASEPEVRDAGVVEFPSFLQNSALFDLILDGSDIYVQLSSGSTVYRACKVNCPPQRRFLRGVSFSA